jgi:hypothetical protein
MLNISENAKNELTKCDTFEFNVFAVRELTEGRELEAVLSFILAKRGCIQGTNIDINKMANYMMAIQSGYKNVTYHNKTHGADLCQTLNFFLTQGGMGEMLKLDKLEYLAVSVAAAVHDFEHPGVNNVFL